MYDFGIRLRNLRESRQLTQAELASRLNVERATVSGYESNIKSPSLTVLKKISMFFNVSTDYLLGIERNAVMDVTGLSERNISVLNELAIMLREKSDD